MRKRKRAQPAKKSDDQPDTTPPEKPMPRRPRRKTAEPQTQQEKYEREEFKREQEEDAKDNPNAPHDGPPRSIERSLAALWGFGWEVHRSESKAKESPTTTPTARLPSPSGGKSPRCWRPAFI